MENKKNVVIIGAGFGGLQAVKKLAKDKDLNITLIDRTNHHLFQPLLYQIATAVLSPADIAIPSRSLTEKYKNVTVIMDEVTRIDKDTNTIYFDGRSLKYDFLILALGAKTGYFGHGDWKKYTIGLKTLADALQIRKKLLMSFEQAENHPSEASKLMKYIIIGGGPTGVELAGSIAELSHNIVRKDFRNIDTGKAEIVLIEGGSDLVPTFDRKLSVYTKKQLERRGVRVMLSARVENIDDKNRVYVKTLEGEKVIEGNIIIWAAGVEPVPLAQNLGFAMDRGKRIIVNEYCFVDGYPNIFIIGDMANQTGPNGKPLPGVSPVAMQQGRYVAKFIRNKLRGKTTKPFHYIHKGNMATIGRKDGIAEYRSFRLTGLMGWLAWLFVHLYYQVGFKNKISILLTWIWSYMTFGAGARVIPDPIHPREE